MGQACLNCANCQTRVGGSLSLLREYGLDVGLDDDFTIHDGENSADR